MWERLDPCANVLPECRDTSTSAPTPTDGGRRATLTAEAADAWTPNAADVPASAQAGRTAAPTRFADPTRCGRWLAPAAPSANRPTVARGRVSRQAGGRAQVAAVAERVRSRMVRGAGTHARELF
jgi:hypothetical protein